MLRIAIAGCGKVADQHVQAIHRIQDCKIVTLCDRELLMAKQLGERFGITACFSDLKEMRRLLNEGFLGGRPIHLESYWSYDLGDTSYVAPMLGNRNHWVRQLPGQLLHNIISHGIAKLAEFLNDEVTEIVATAHQSEQLRSLGAQEVLDELRVLMRDTSGTTAFFCFSTQVRGLNQLRVYGPAGSVTADIITGSFVRNINRSYKSYLTYFIPPLRNAREHFRNASRNVINFARRRLYQDFGMKELIERFYNSIRLGSEPPIPYREIILTARVMDEIFAQIYPSEARKSLTQMNRASADTPVWSAIQ